MGQELGSRAVHQAGKWQLSSCYHSLPSLSSSALSIQPYSLPSPPPPLFSTILIFSTIPPSLPLSVFIRSQHSKHPFPLRSFEIKGITKKTNLRWIIEKLPPGQAPATQLPLFRVSVGCYHCTLEYFGCLHFLKHFPFFIFTKKQT
jgi:hypothetical protein